MPLAELCSLMRWHFVNFLLVARYVGLVMPILRMFCCNRQQRYSALVPLVEMHMRHNDPLVRGMAVWALSNLTNFNQFQALMQDYLPDETDETVITEWATECAVHTYNCVS